MAKQTKLDLKKELENKIESLNQSSDFFKNLGFNEKNIKDDSNQTCYCVSETYDELEFWVDSFEDDESPRYCFAFAIPSKINNSDIAGILPRVWWIGENDNDILSDDYYEKIIFELDGVDFEKIQPKLKKFKKGNNCNGDAIGDLKSTLVSEKEERYIVYYLKRGEEEESVKKFEKEFTTFLNFRDQIMSVGIIDDIKELLLRNHNIILHGAPGTGKTYLAKEIAKAMGCSDSEIGFVQFHQSYDYTDFVEGLRPIKRDKEQIGFERKDGIFKEFCKRALEQFRDNTKLYNETEDATVRMLAEQFIEDAVSGKRVFSLKSGSSFHLKKKPFKRKTDFTIIAYNPKNKSPVTLQKKLLYKVLCNSKKFDNATAIRNDFFSRKKSDVASYLWSLNKVFKEEFLNKTFKKRLIDSKILNKFVFIIDEINRGEMAKIFGELFFSIDPGYRGTKGKIRTQYANLQEKPNEFDVALGIEQKKTNEDNYGHFFVPENVYIIGTMNDIDRSVDSMDFAMRRRFAFREISAENRIEMLNELGGNRSDAENRMKKLNEAIEKIPGLSAAYHIGPAYFLNLKKYGNDFDKLWEYHIEGVVKEYLRGMDSANEKIKDLAKAFDYSKIESRYS